jgi:hypothetical protein
MGLGGQHPAEENLLLGGRAVRIDLDIGASRRQPLDLAHCGDALGALEIVDDVDRDRRGKAVVGERQLDAVSKMQAPDNFGLAVHQRIFRNVDAERFQTRARLHQVLDEESFARPDIEHAVARPQAEMRDHVLGDRQPAPIVAIPAIAGVPRAVEIFAPVLSGDPNILFALCDCALLDIALGPRIAAQQINFGHPGPSPKLLLAASRLPPSEVWLPVRSGRSAGDTRRSPP